MKFFHKLALALLAAMVFAPCAEATVFTVGRDSSCTHTRLSQAISAAQANGPGFDEIHIAKQHNELLNVQYFIVDQSLTLIGGFDTCAATTPNGKTLLRSTGTGSVFRITSQPARASIVSIFGLEIVGNGTRVDKGGAFATFGRAFVFVYDSHLHDLNASNGGAIYLDSFGANQAPRMYLSNVLIENNQAAEGGGIYCYGSANVTLNPSTAIRNNTANSGGGAALRGCSWQQNGSVLSDNYATDGGGIHAANGAYVQLQWGDEGVGAVAPVIANNRAAYSGAGVLLTDPGSVLDARGAQFRGNSIKATAIGEGAALLVGWGASAQLQRDSHCPSKSLQVDQCSYIVANTSTVDSSASTPSIIEARAGGLISISGTFITGNSVIARERLGGAILQASPYQPMQTGIILSNSVLLGNQARALLSATEFNPDGLPVSVGRITAKLITTKRNSVDAIVGSAFGSYRSSLTLAASVIDESAPLLRNPATADSIFDCVLSRTELGVPATRSLVADPKLAAIGNPLAASPAIDFCSSDGLPLGESDVLGNPRPLKIFEVWDRFGPVDVGAFEFAPPPIVIGPPG